MMRQVWRVVVLLALSGVSLQLYFAGRIALMGVLDPQSTTFQRSEIWRLATDRGQVLWSQSWRPSARTTQTRLRRVEP